MSTISPFGNILHSKVLYTSPHGAASVLDVLFLSEPRQRMRTGHGPGVWNIHPKAINRVSGDVFKSRPLFASLARDFISQSNDLEGDAANDLQIETSRRQQTKK